MLIAVFKYAISSVNRANILSSDEVNSDVEGPNSIVDPTTDPESPEYKWYYNMDFASKDFENSDENGEFVWQ